MQSESKKGIYLGESPSEAHYLDHSGAGEFQAQLNSLEQNMQMMAEQMECLTQVMAETQRKLKVLRDSVPETKKEPQEEKEEIIEEPPLSPREALRQRRLLRFSSP